MLNPMKREVKLLFVWNDSTLLKPMPCSFSTTDFNLDHRQLLEETEAPLKICFK